MRRIAVHIGPLYHLDGSRPARSGIGFYTDSLLAALREETAASAEIEMTAFAPLASRPVVEEMGQDGVFAWWPSHGPPPRLDTAGRWRPMTQSEDSPAYKVVRRLGLMAARRAAQKYDVLHLPSPFVLPPEKYAPRVTVATLYDMTVRTMPHSHEESNIRTWEAFHDFITARKAWVLTISEASKRDIVSHLNLPPERVTVTPLAPRRATRRLPSGDERDILLRAIPGWRDAPFVLYAGTLEPRKNWERLVRAFGILHREAPVLRGYRLILAGGAWKGQADRLQEVVAEESLGDAILWTNYIADETMNALMSACEAFAYPSLGEGFGMPPLEAMTCGAPVITSNVSSLPEVVGDAGILVTPEETEAIAAALYRLLSDSAENARYREKAVARAQQFSWKRTARLTLEAYANAEREAR